MNDGLCFSRKSMEVGQAGQHLSLLKLSRDCIPNGPILSLGLLCFCRHFLEDKVLLLLRYDNYGSYLLPPPTLARYQRQREKETRKKLNEVIFFRIRNALQVFDLYYTTIRDRFSSVPLLFWRNNNCVYDRAIGDTRENGVSFLIRCGLLKSRPPSFTHGRIFSHSAHSKTDSLSRFYFYDFSCSITDENLANEGDTSASEDHDRWTGHQGRQPI